MTASRWLSCAKPLIRPTCCLQLHRSWNQGNGEPAAAGSFSALAQYQQFSSLAPPWASQARPTAQQGHTEAHASYPDLSDLVLDMQDPDLDSTDGGFNSRRPAAYDLLDMNDDRTHRGSPTFPL